MLLFGQVGVKQTQHERGASLRPMSPPGQSPADRDTDRKGLSWASSPPRPTFLRGTARLPSDRGRPCRCSSGPPACSAPHWSAAATLSATRRRAARCGDPSGAAGSEARLEVPRVDHRRFDVKHGAPGEPRLDGVEDDLGISRPGRQHRLPIARVAGHMIWLASLVTLPAPVFR